MNAEQSEIVGLAFENFQKTTPFKGKWKKRKTCEVNDIAVPPILVYADLMGTGDRRCVEAAQKIYNELLQDKF